MALGNLNVNDKTPVDDFDPDHWAVFSLDFSIIIIIFTIFVL